jgi:hypothetical protein
MMCFCLALGFSYCCTSFLGITILWSPFVIYLYLECLQSVLDVLGFYSKLCEDSLNFTFTPAFAIPKEQVDDVFQLVLLVTS